MKKEYQFDFNNAISLSNGYRVDLLSGTIIDTENNVLDVYLSEQEIETLCIHAKRRLSTSEFVDIWHEVTSKRISAGTVDRYRSTISNKLNISSFSTLRSKSSRQS